MVSDLFEQKDHQIGKNVFGDVNEYFRSKLRGKTVQGFWHSVREVMSYVTVRITV
jgi:hypothetical protein